MNASSLIHRPSLSPSDVKIAPDSPLLTLSDDEQSALRQAMADFVNSEVAGVNENDSKRCAAVLVLREMYSKAGIFQDQICDTKTCLDFATVTVDWPVLRGERKPRYCRRCGEWALKILETLGLAGTHTPYDNPALREGFESPLGKRSINLDG